MLTDENGMVRLTFIKVISINEKYVNPHEQTMVGPHKIEYCSGNTVVQLKKGYKSTVLLALSGEREVNQQETLKAMGFEEKQSFVKVAKYFPAKETKAAIANMRAHFV